MTTRDWRDRATPNLIADARQLVAGFGETRDDGAYTRCVLRVEADDPELKKECIDKINERRFNFQRTKTKFGLQISQDGADVLTEWADESGKFYPAVLQTEEGKRMMEPFPGEKVFETRESLLNDSLAKRAQAEEELARELKQMAEEMHEVYALDKKWQDQVRRALDYLRSIPPEMRHTAGCHRCTTGCLRCSSGAKKGSDQPPPVLSTSLVRRLLGYGLLATAAAGAPVEASSSGGGAAAAGGGGGGVTRRPERAPKKKGGESSHATLVSMQNQPIANVAVTTRDSALWALRAAAEAGIFFVVKEDYAEDIMKVVMNAMNEMYDLARWVSASSPTEVSLPQEVPEYQRIHDKTMRDYFGEDVYGMAVSGSVDGGVAMESVEAKSTWFAFKNASVSIAMGHADLKPALEQSLSVFAQNLRSPGEPKPFTVPARALARLREKGQALTPAESAHVEALKSALDRAYKWHLDKYRREMRQYGDLKINVERVFTGPEDERIDRMNQDYRISVAEDERDLVTASLSELKRVETMRADLEEARTKYRDALRLAEQTARSGEGREAAALERVEAEREAARQAVEELAFSRVELRDTMDGLAECRQELDDMRQMSLAQRYQDVEASLSDSNPESFSLVVRECKRIVREIDEYRFSSSSFTLEDYAASYKAGNAVRQMCESAETRLSERLVGLETRCDELERRVASSPDDNVLQNELQVASTDWSILKALKIQLDNAHVVLTGINEFASRGVVEASGIQTAPLGRALQDVMTRSDVEWRFTDLFCIPAIMTCNAETAEEQRSVQYLALNRLAKNMAETLFAEVDDKTVLEDLQTGSLRTIAQRIAKPRPTLEGAARCKMVLNTFNTALTDLRASRRAVATSAAGVDNENTPRKMAPFETLWHAEQQVVMDWFTRLYTKSCLKETEGSMVPLVVSMFPEGPRRQEVLEELRRYGDSAETFGGAMFDVAIRELDEALGANEVAWEGGFMLAADYSMMLLPNSWYLAMMDPDNSSMWGNTTTPRFPRLFSYLDGAPEILGAMVAGGALGAASVDKPFVMHLLSMGGAVAAPAVPLLRVGIVAAGAVAAENEPRVAARKIYLTGMGITSALLFGYEAFSNATNEYRARYGDLLTDTVTEHVHNKYFWMPGDTLGQIGESARNVLVPFTTAAVGGASALGAGLGVNALLAGTALASATGPVALAGLVAGVSSGLLTYTTMDSAIPHATGSMANRKEDLMRALWGYASQAFGGGEVNQLLWVLLAFGSSLFVERQRRMSALQAGQRGNTNWGAIVARQLSRGFKTLSFSLAVGTVACFIDEATLPALNQFASQVMRWSSRARRRTLKSLAKTYVRSMRLRGLSVSPVDAQRIFSTIDISTELVPQLVVQCVTGNYFRIHFVWSGVLEMGALAVGAYALGRLFELGDLADPPSRALLSDEDRRERDTRLIRDLQGIREEQREPDVESMFKRFAKVLVSHTTGEVGRLQFVADSATYMRDAALQRMPRALGGRDKVRNVQDVIGVSDQPQQVPDPQQQQPGILDKAYQSLPNRPRLLGGKPAQRSVGDILGATPQSGAQQQGQWRRNRRTYAWDKVEG